MAREWQQTKMSNYVMPNAVYYQTLWAVRDLTRMEERLEELSMRDINPSGSSVVKETSSKYSKRKNKVEDDVIELTILRERITGINSALQEVPERYRKRIIDNIVCKEPTNRYQDKTWRVWKQKFLYGVAKNLSIM